MPKAAGRRKRDSSSSSSSQLCGRELVRIALEVEVEGEVEFGGMRGNAELVGLASDGLR